jgi:Asp-tRNA(Asn)/Glu-tRNA(Gln) amidotransferase B subunit
MDYRYFPEPDLQILEIRETDIPKISDLAELPNQKRQKYDHDKDETIKREQCVARQAI